jgi:hypothetical protein
MHSPVWLGCLERDRRPSIAPSLRPVANSVVVSLQQRRIDCDCLPQMSQARIAQGLRGYGQTYRHDEAIAWPAPSYGRHAERHHVRRNMAHHNGSVAIFELGIKFA